MTGVPLPAYKQFWTDKWPFLKNDYKELITKYPEAAPSLHQLYKVFCDIEEVTLPLVGESEEWAVIVSSAEDNRENFSKTLCSKLLFTALYCTYTVMLNVLKNILKVRSQTGQTTETDGFKEVHSRKRHSTEEAARTPKKATLSETSAKAATKNVLPPSGKRIWTLAPLLQNPVQQQRR
jgi:hypothetical protein